MLEIIETKKEREEYQMTGRIEQIIDALELLIENCKFKSSSTELIIVNRVDIDEIIRDFKMTVPEEIENYQRVVSNKEAILNDAMAKAQEAIDNASVQINQITREHQIIIQQAYAQANEIVDFAMQQAQEIIDRATIEANSMRVSTEGHSDGMPVGKKDMCIKDNMLKHIKNALLKRWQHAVLRGNKKKPYQYDAQRQKNKSDIRIIVMGIGGAGNSFISRTMDEQIGGLEFIAVNSDWQALQICKAPKRLQTGTKLCNGLGAGAKPETGKMAAEESSEEIRDAIRGASMVFICCSMGGGTGTGASPVVARIAKEMGICTVGFVTKPFSFEGKERMSNAIQGLRLLKEHTDALVTISNDAVLKAVDRGTALSEALATTDKVILHGMLAIKNLINPNTINCKNLTELRDIVRGKGLGHISYGTAKGEGRMIAALQMAINSPWLETSIKDAAQVLLYLHGDISEVEASYAAQYIRKMTGRDNVAYARYDEKKANEATVVVIVFEAEQKLNILDFLERAEECDKYIGKAEQKLEIPDFLK